VVMELLRGETIEALSRKHGLTMAELSEWRDAFIANGMDGFKKKPEEAKLARAERRIGQLEMELDLVKKKNEFIAKQRKS
ncbi:MAG TPA: helix-turn-helix domain-containing protein, partial [Bacteroidales bacterium]|nr:helix-turn-helix domain-containing protein [Bacteroidales bacterium]